MTETAPMWLGRAYSLSLAVHAATIAAVLAIAAYGLTMGGANAAPDTWPFALAMMVPVLLLATPSVIALLSWYLCRRRGTPPGGGHMTLSTAAGAAILALVALAVINA